MNTVTIPDPADVQRVLASEFPDAILNAAYYQCSGKNSKWCVNVTYVEVSFHGSGETPEEALEALREKARGYDPLAFEKAALEAAGYKLVPA